MSTSGSRIFQNCVNFTVIFHLSIIFIKFKLLQNAGVPLIPKIHKFEEEHFDDISTEFHEMGAQLYHPDSDQDPQAFRVWILNQQTMD
jgi:hypothetical protein